MVSATVLVAAMDGGLSAFLVAAAIGGGSYVATRRLMNEVPDRILQTQVAVLEAQLDQEIERKAPEEEIKALRAEIKERTEKLTETLELQRWGNKEMAAAVGVASFACPALGAVVFAAVTRDKWLPLTDGLFTAETKDPRGFFEKTGALRQCLAEPA